MTLDPNQSVIALDYGDKRVGVARASNVARIANPLTTLDNDNDLIDKIKDIVSTENVGLIVVGYPRGMDGQLTEQTQKVDNFIDQLKVLNIEIKKQDESLTSVNAEAELTAKRSSFNKAEIDALAATLILEDYLVSLER